MAAHLADVVVVIHFAFVVFVVFGGLLVLWRGWMALVHVPAALWGAWIEFAGWICPLTPLENWLRARAGTGAYATTFVERYVTAILYPSGLTRDVQWALGGLVLLINVVIYLAVWRRRRSK